MTPHLLAALLDDHEVAALRRALDLLARRCRDDGHKMPAGLAALAEMTTPANTGPRRPAVDAGPGVGEAGPVTPLAVDYADAARLVGVSARQVRRLVASGALPVVHIGGAGSPRIRVEDLNRYLDGQVPSA
ncbi:MAG: helix-turn-helix domain-containing protein [Acidimicrobiales bacterium]